MRYVRDVQRPILMMVLSEAPLNFIAMAPPARRLCDETRSRVYPRAMRPITMSATAVWCGVKWNPDALEVIVETGTASFGSGAGSSSSKRFRMRAMGRSRACWAGEARRGSGCPSKTYFWAILRSATATD